MVLIVKLFLKLDPKLCLNFSILTPPLLIFAKAPTFYLTTHSSIFRFVPVLQHLPLSARCSLAVTRCTFTKISITCTSPLPVTVLQRNAPNPGRDKARTRRNSISGALNLLQSRQIHTQSLTKCSG